MKLSRYKKELRAGKLNGRVVRSSAGLEYIIIKIHNIYNDGSTKRMYLKSITKDADRCPDTLIASEFELLPMNKAISILFGL